ncbi:MAG: AsmA-like C-terminal region-containing protein [Bacteroidia bacterium]|nr:AsmA-like C-terminal region-containing protein [Bacteroidia bacterium]
MFKKFLKRFFIGFGIALFLLISSGIIITLAYSDEIKQYFISKINNYLNTEIKVGSVDFSILKKFPDACINFHDVVAMSAPGYDEKIFKGAGYDTLLVAKDVYLQFNVFDIFSKKYNIKAIHIDDGYSTILIDKKGGDNYHFWKTPENSDTTAFNLDLRDVRLSKFTVKFYNKAQNLEFKCSTTDFAVSGKFNDDNYELQTQGDLKVKKFLIDKVNYIKNDAITLKLKFDVNNKQFKIKSGRLNIKNLTFDVFGNYSYPDSKINLQIKGNDIDVNTFISALPEDIQKNFEGFESNGLFYFVTNIKGKLDYENTPSINATFGLENSTIKQKNSGLTLNNVFAKGSFSNGDKQSAQTSYLTIDTIYASVKDSKFSAHYAVKNFSKPHIELKISGNFELSQIKDLFTIDTLKVFNGNMNADFSFSGNVASLSGITAAEYRKAITQGKVQLQNANMQIVNSKDEFTNINAGFTFHNNDVRIDSLSFLMNKHDFEISGYFKNLIAYMMLDNEPLGIEARIHSKYIDIKKLLSSDSESSGIALPKNIKLAANVSVDNIDYGKFSAKRASGFIEISDNTLTFTSLSLDALNGSLKADGALRITTQKNIILQSSANLKNINVSQLFYAFDNFSQTFILDKHLKGIINADVKVSCEWNDKMELDQKKLIASCSMQINNGELINFDPMFKLSDYIALTELKHIKFASLTNDILIKDRKVIIPHMEIKSSAFNIELSGEHTFDNTFDYKLKVLLSDVLSKKAKKAKKENEEFGQIEDDGLGRTSLFLSIKGNVDDYKISYDTKMVKEHIKENMKVEKENLKTILNEEFGWFKNDTTLAKKKQKKEELKKPQFMIEWDEDKPEEDQSGKK